MGVVINMKKLFSAFAIFTIVICSVTFALSSTLIVQAESSTIRIYLDGTEVVPDVSPVLRDSRIFVPLRFVSEYFGALVYWDAENQQVWLEIGSRDVLIRLGGPTTQLGIDSPPFILNGRVMVPLRAIAELFNLDVEYADRHVHINYNEQSPVFRNLTDNSIIHSGFSYHFFMEDGQFYVAETNRGSRSHDLWFPGVYSALRLDANFSNLLRDEEGWLIFIFHPPSGEAHWTRLYAISPSGEVSVLHDGTILGFSHNQDTIYLSLQNHYQIGSPIIEFGTNILKIEYRKNEQPRLLGQRGFIYGQFLEFQDYYNNGIYFPIMKLGGIEGLFDFENNVLYIIGVDTTSLNPFESAGLFRICLESNTQEKLRGLLQDEYSIRR
jgi:hypothetical protein